MGKQTAISWTDHTFNPWWGCTRVSEGCVHCYAETFSKRTGHDIWGPTADRRFFKQPHWNEPLSWNAKATRQELVFCASMADVFEKPSREIIEPIMDSERERLGWTIGKTPNLTWLLLTKRIENADHYLSMMFPEMWYDGKVPGNVWLGVTTENQERYDERIDTLLALKQKYSIPVAWLSIEPQIGPVSLKNKPVDWVIVGGESGAGCRPFDIEWARKLRDESRAIKAAFFLKQLGGHPNKQHDIAAFPADLQIQEFPK